MNAAADTVRAQGEIAETHSAEPASQPGRNKIYDVLAPCFARYHRRKRELAKGAVVLELGCAEGRQPISLSDIAQRAEGVDISADAIRKGEAEIARRGVTNVRLSVQNAEAMDFPDATFDLVFGAGILQLADYNKMMAELRRVLKPGGVALFAEPLGGNPVINMYRRKNAADRHDGHPLTRADIRAFGQAFAGVRVHRYGLTTLAGLPFIGTPLAKPVQMAGEAWDALLLRTPGIKDWAWYALLEGRRS